MKKIAMLAFIFILLSQNIFSESFRVKKVVEVELNDETTSKQVRLAMGEALHLVLPSERVFLQGLQMKIKMPASLADYGNAVAYSFYTDVTPEPNENNIDYEANRLLIETFSHRLTYHFEIPLSDSAESSNDPYTKTIMLPFDKPIDEIFFRVYIVMKGIPDGLWDSYIDIELKPILANKGVLDLNIKYPETEDSDESQSFIVFIDDDLQEYTGESILLDSGIHHVTVSSEFFRTEVQTFSIEKAKSTSLEIQLQDIAPLLAISAPKNVRFFLNDLEYEDFSQPIKVTTGTHQLRFSIGEYEIIRTVEVLNGRTYNIDVSFDLKITEE